MRRPKEESRQAVDTKERQRLCNVTTGKKVRRDSAGQKGEYKREKVGTSWENT